MSDLMLEIKNFAQGVKYGSDASMLENNALADAQNFLPNGAIGGAQKIKVWHKDLLAVDGTADDRIWALSPTIAGASAALETADTLIPRFDDIDEVYYFYSNNFDDGTVNYGTPAATPQVPILVNGTSWTTYYNFVTPSLTASIRAGFFLNTDVVITTAKPLCISVPVRENGAYNVLTHLATCDIFYALYLPTGTDPATTDQASATVNVGDLGLGRLEFRIVPTSGRATLPAGEYYAVITQATTTPLVDGYSFLSPPTFSDELFGWAEIPTIYTAQAVADSDITCTFGSNGATGDKITVASTHTFPSGVVEASKVYHGDVGFYFAANGTTSGELDVVVDLDLQTYTMSCTRTYDVGDSYAEGDFVDDGAGNFYCSKAPANLGNALNNATWWDPISVIEVVYYSSGLINLFRISTIITTSGGRRNTPTSVTVDYNTSGPGTLAEMMVYQRNSVASDFTVSADRLYKAARYTERNPDMPEGEVVRTDTELPIYAISDGKAFFMLYQTVDLVDSAADAQIVSGAMFNTFDQYTRWRTDAGVLSSGRINYYLPKFIGQVNAYCNYQNIMVFGGVGGVALFDPKNMLESANKGKVYTPWRDIVIPNINQRTDSDYLTDAGITPVSVHPPVVNDIFVYGEQPGRLILVLKDYIVIGGGDTIQTASKSYEWQQLGVAQLGDGLDYLTKGIGFGSRALFNTQRGDLYSLSGVPPVDFVSDINTLQITKEGSIGVVKHWLDTKQGYIVGVFDDGQLFRMDGSLIPQPFGTDITTTTDGKRVDIGITGLSWDDASRRLWIHTDGYLARSYMVSTTFTEVNVSARSYVWDADTDSFWPVVNPMDEETRTNLPSVFRDGNVSWSAGYHYDLSDAQFVFTLECDIAGKDPLPLKNDDESLYQPENSTEHALESTAFLVTKLFTSLDHASQVRQLATLARLIDGTDTTISLISEGTTTVLGTFSGSTTFATLASKMVEKKLNAVPRSNSFQIKLTTTNQYADVIRNLLIKANLAGVVR